MFSKLSTVAICSPLILSFESGILNHLAALLREPVLLLAAAEFVRDGHFYKPCPDQRVENLVPELSPVGSSQEFH